MNKKTPSPAKRVAIPLIAVVIVCLCIGALVPGMRALHKLRREKTARRKHNQTVERDVAQLRLEVEHDSKTDEWWERVAREDLHLAGPGETIFVFAPDPRTPERRP